MLLQTDNLSPRATENMRTLKHEPTNRDSVKLRTALHSTCDITHWGLRKSCHWLILYTGKLSRKKTFVKWKISQRNLLWVNGLWMGHMHTPLKVHKENFHEWSQIRKIRKGFLPQKFPSIRYKRLASTLASRHAQPYSSNICLDQMCSFLLPSTFILPVYERCMICRWSCDEAVYSSIRPYPHQSQSLPPSITIVNQ